jgi:hypothetical protein
MAITYLTGCSTEHTRTAGRDDLGLLATPASSVAKQIEHYTAGGGWAADNGCFAETAARPFDRARWLDWLAELADLNAVMGEERSILETCRFAVLPDVVGDPVATWERSAPWVDLVREMGYPVAIVAQDGLEALPDLVELVLEHADVLFLGGSTEWKLGPGAAELTRRAKAAGLAVHMGRVNSLKRLRYAESIGCDSADGTFVGFAPEENVRRLFGWLDELALERIRTHTPAPTAREADTMTDDNVRADRKRCPKCGLVKDRATGFTTRANGRIFSWCKACNLEYNRARRATKRADQSPDDVG